MEEYLIEKSWIDIYNNKIIIKLINDKSSTKKLYTKYKDYLLNFILLENTISIEGTSTKGIIDKNKIIWNNNTIWYKNIYANLDLYYTHKAGPIFICPNDYFIVKTLKKGRVWEEGIINKMQHHIKDKKNVIDIGAHIGTHSICYSKMIKGNVYAFEAQIYMYDVLKKNIEYQDIKNIYIYHNAIGHLNNYQVTINDKVIDGMKLKNGIKYNTKELVNYGGVQLGEGTEKVIMRTIDSYNLNDIDYIKIDIEGCEELALYGAFNTIKKCRPVIIFEYRVDKCITSSMKNMMPIDENIINFKTVKRIELELDYKFIHDYNYYGNDSLLIPKEKL